MKEAVILLNMGGPNNLEEVEVFLKNMFADKNILTMKSGLLRSFVGGMIVFNRTESSQEIYRELGGKSPIVGHTKKLVAKLQERLGENVIVDFVMRYTPPFASEVIEKLNQEDIDKIYLIPLYPHYSTTTTKSSLEDFEETYHDSEGDALLVEIKHFFENETYNKAIVANIKKKMADSDYVDFDIIFSAHGLPQKIVDAGDTYEKHVKRHVTILKEMLIKEDMKFHKIHLAYQSKVGPMKWLEPSLEDKLKSVRNKGVIIYPIAFTIDNSETDFELEIEYREIAEEMGFKDYRVCECPNDNELFVDTLLEIYREDEMKVVIFDMDGTLLDSQKDITISINYVREKNYNLEPLTESFIVEAINQEVRNLSKLFYNTEIYEDSARVIFEKHYDTQCIQNPYLYSGVYETLENLINEGVKISVATNAPTQFASRMLTHLGVANMFDMIIGADKVSASKPNPEMINKILDFYSFDKENHLAWMVGDNSKDIQSAQNAGINAIFATWGFSPESLHDTTVHTPQEVLDIVL